MYEVAIEWQIADEPQRYTATHTEALTIGRSSSCNITLKDPKISRQHAQIYYQEGEFYLANLSGTNPIAINEQWRLEPKTRTMLHAGDRLRLGDVTVYIKTLHPADLA